MGAVTIVVFVSVDFNVSIEWFKLQEGNDWLIFFMSYGVCGESLPPSSTSTEIILHKE